MKPVKGGFSCDFCSKRVIDLSHLNRDQLNSWKEKNGSQCVIINSEFNVDHVKMSLAKFGLALLLVAGSSLFVFSNAQTSNTFQQVGKILNSDTDTTDAKLTVHLIDKKGRPVSGHVWITDENDREFEMFEKEIGVYEVPLLDDMREMMITIQAERNSVIRTVYITEPLGVVPIEINMDEKVKKLRKKDMSRTAGYF